MNRQNCATHALKASFVNLDTSLMIDPVLYLNEVYLAQNRMLRELGRDFSELSSYVENLKENEWMVAFFGPFSSSKFYDPDDYSESYLYYPDEQYHFILREKDGTWTQMDYNSAFATVANIQEEVKCFEEKGYKPYFFAVSYIRSDSAG